MTKYEFNYRLKNAFGLFLIVFLMILVIIGSGKRNEPLEVKADVQPAEVQVIEKVIYEVPDTPEEYIIYKFGEDANKAFLLLKGNGEERCAENRHLDPKAVNDNRTWGGVGVDRGIFQINSVYHPLTEAEAFDWKANIDYAYRMYLNDGKTFVRWTCGKFYGI